MKKLLLPFIAVVFFGTNANAHEKVGVKRVGAFISELINDTNQDFEIKKNGITVARINKKSVFSKPIQLQIDERVDGVFAKNFKVFGNEPIIIEISNNNKKIELALMVSVTQEKKLDEAARVTVMLYPKGSPSRPIEKWSSELTYDELDLSIYLTFSEDKSGQIDVIIDVGASARGKQID